jgi:hypothetical protein
MQLIDVLETRSDSISIVESATGINASCDDYGKWYLSTQSECYEGDGNVGVSEASYELSDDALDTLLNLLRIPIKYIKRCTEEEGGVWLAEKSVNYWIRKYGDLSFLVQDRGEEFPLITQVFPGKRMYLPGDKVNDLIIEYLDGEVNIASFVVVDDVFNALYLTDREIEVDGGKALLGVRVLYSDCFTITPRFDGVLYEPETGATFCWPTVGRKFRVASNTLHQIMEQIEEFLDLSIDGLNENLIPALQSSADRYPKLIEADGFLTRLCADLRLSQKVKQELAAMFKMVNYMPMELVRDVAAYTTSIEDSDNIDLNVARDIQIALSNYIVRGSFK